MKKIFLIVFALLSLNVMAQAPLNKYTSALSLRLQSDKSNNYLVWVSFKDKGEDCSKFLSSPQSVLSTKAIERRLKYKLPALDNSDLPVNGSYVKEINLLGGTVKQKSRWFNSISMFASKELIEKIAALPFVDKIDVVVSYAANMKTETLHAISKENLSDSPKNGDVLDYGYSLTQLQQMNVPAVHNLGYHGEGMTVAVLDAGFSLLSHEVFQTMHIIAKWDFVNNNPGVGDSTDMGEGSHGTQTLSTIGGYKNGKQIGPAYAANFILAKTENTDSETPIEEDNWIAGIEWADSIGVDVSSTSLGYIDFDSPYTSYTWQDMNGNTCRITKAADLAVKKGIVVVNSAGNEGYNSSHNTLGAPADGDSVITVGAVTSSGTRASFSSVGPTVDGRIKPDIMAMGEEVSVASPYSTTGYTYNDGTSFSCPLAAGVATLVLQAHPYLTPIQIREALRNTASLHTSPNNTMGWGIINALSAVSYYTPVELSSFSCTAGNNGVALNWTTATEKNNSGFEIQRRLLNSQDKHFSTIGFVAGNGTSTEKHSYVYNDKPEAGQYIYRLKQVDLDGTVGFSNEIEVTYSTVNSFVLFQNYPNPFNPVTNIKFEMPSAGHVRLALYDILGNLVKTLLDESKDKGSYSYSLNAENMASGTYFVKMLAGGYQKTIKIALVK